MRGVWRIYRAPALLAGISSIGLVAALLCEGAIDNLWSFAVGLPALVIICRLGLAKYTARL